MAEKQLTIRDLNAIEKKSIRDALELFIQTNADYTKKVDKAWSQRIILADMLDLLMWKQFR